MVHSCDLPLRKAKTVVEKAVKYSEEEGLEEVSHRSLKRALREMKIDTPISEKEVKRVQSPEGMLNRARSIGMPSEKRVQENIVSLHKRLTAKRDWLITRKRAIEKAKEILFKMERQLTRMSV
jgi:argininosuccinate lyase